MITLNEIKKNLDILDVAKSYGVQINRQGMANCIFHNDSNASLKFYENTNSFHCFGCGVGGSVIDFIKLAENLTTAGAIAKAKELLGISEKDSVARQTRPQIAVNL